MSIHLPTPVLLAATLAAVAGDLALTASTAWGDAASATPAPKTIPPEALLTGKVIEEARIEGAEARVVEADGRFLLSLHNPGDEPLDLAFEVGAYETSGVAYGRMGPIPRLIQTQPIAAVVEPGATVAVALDYRPTPLPEGVSQEDGYFRTIQFTMGEVAAEPIVADAFVNLVEIE